MSPKTCASSLAVCYQLDNEGLEKINDQERQIKRARREREAARRREEGEG